MKHGAVTVANTATQILTLDRNKAGFLIANIGGQTVYLGGSGVTTASGFPLDAGEKIASDGHTEFEGELYGIVAASTCEVRTLEWGESEI